MSAVQQCTSSCSMKSPRVFVNYTRGARAPPCGRLCTICYDTQSSRPSDGKQLTGKIDSRSGDARAAGGGCMLLNVLVTNEVVLYISGCIIRRGQGFAADVCVCVLTQVKPPRVCRFCTCKKHRLTQPCLLPWRSSEGGVHVCGDVTRSSASAQNLQKGYRRCGAPPSVAETGLSLPLQHRIKK